MGAAVVPGLLQVGADEHAGDGAQPGLAQHPTASPQKVVKVGAVNQPRKRSSRQVTEGDRLNGSIGGGSGLEKPPMLACYKAQQLGLVLWPLVSLFEQLRGTLLLDSYSY